VVNVGEDPPCIRYGFTSRLWRSQMWSFSLTCDLRKKAFELERAGQFQDIEEAPKKVTQWPRFGPDPAYAQPERSLPPAAPKVLVVPTIETLRRVGSDAGYTEIRVTNLAASAAYCKALGPCPDTLFAEIEWNGFRLLFDGVEDETSRERNLLVTEAGALRGELVFAIENTLFGSPTNSLKLSVYSRGGAAWIKKALQSTKVPATLVDVFETSLTFLRAPEAPLRGQRRMLTAALGTRLVRGPQAGSYEVFAGAGSYAQVVAKQEFFNKLSLSSQGQPLAATIRPPLPGKETWGLAVGMRDSNTGRIKILLTEQEAKRVDAELKRLSPAQLGPLRHGEIFVYPLRKDR